MMRMLGLAAAAFLMLASASAQTTAPAQQGAAPEQRTNCVPAAPGESAQNRGDNAQAVEKSAILPSAEGHRDSAAPTVQRDGKSAEVASNCPQEKDPPKTGDRKG